MIGFFYSSKLVDFRAILMSFLNFLSQKNTQVNFQEQSLFEIKVIKEKVVFKMLRQLAIFKKTINSEILGVRG